MKTIEERAKEYVAKSWSDIPVGDFNEDHVTFENIVTEAYFAGAQSEHAELTHWHDPKEELPEEGECVLIKAVDELGNEALYMGSWEGDRYITDLGLVFGNDFDNESVPDMNIKVIGWRKIHG